MTLPLYLFLVTVSITVYPETPILSKIFRTLGNYQELVIISIFLTASTTKFLLI